MRKITAIFLFAAVLLMEQFSLAQENKQTQTVRTWPEQGAKWYYSYVNFSTTGYVHVECSGDTTLIDVSTSREYQNCKILSKSRYTFDFISGNYNSESLGNEYIWSNEDSVLIYRHNKFYLLYNFSAEIGDEWTIPETYYSGCDTIGRIVVTGKGDTLIHSEMLRYIDVIPKESSNWSIRGKVIEKIGPIEWYMLPETEGCIADLFEGGIFRCFQDGLFEYQSGITPYCDYIVSTPENISEKLINIFPNPAKNSLMVHFANSVNVQIIIIDLFGHEVYRSSAFEDLTKIDVSKLSRGLYTVRITDNKQIFMTNKIIINR